MIDWQSTKRQATKLWRMPVFKGGISFAAIVAAVLFLAGARDALQLVLDLVHFVEGWAIHPAFGWAFLLLAFAMMALGIRQVGIAEEAETEKRKQIIDAYIEAQNSQISDVFREPLRIAQRVQQERRVHQLTDALAQAESAVSAKEEAINQFERQGGTDNAVGRAAETISLERLINVLREARGVAEPWNLSHPASATHDENLIYRPADNLHAIRDWRDQTVTANRELIEFRAYLEQENRRLAGMAV